MLSKNQLKSVRALHQKKEREASQLFIAEGTRCVLETAAGPFTVEGIYALPGWLEEHGGAVSALGIPCEAVTQAEMERISALSTPGPVLAVIRMLPSPVPVSPDPARLTLVLDEIRDPGNMGTIIRTADWFGIRQVICSPGSVEIYNPKVIQSTMGSFNRVRTAYVPLQEYLRQFPPGLNIYGTVLDGNDLYEETLSPAGVIVIGNESQGISEELLPLLTHRLTIPSFTGHENTDGHAESLNAAVAAALVCAEFRRRFRI